MQLLQCLVVFLPFCGIFTWNKPALSVSIHSSTSYLHSDPIVSSASSAFCSENRPFCGWFLYFHRVIGFYTFTVPLLRHPDQPLRRRGQRSKPRILAGGPTAPAVQHAAGTAAQILAGPC